MTHIGIAGGIGSGKSSIAKAFEQLGIPVYYADNEAKRLMHESIEIKDALIKNFGTGLYIDNILQKDKLASIIFEDPSARFIVNNIVHPVVRNDFILWSKNCHSDITIIEAAIMFDTGFYKFLDVTILVLADEKQRIDRVMRRDGSCQRKVMRRIAAQTNPDEHKKLATYLINNNDNDEVLPQILNIFKQIKQNG